MRRARKQKKKLEFSQMHVVFADTLVFLVFIINALLAWFEKAQISDVAVAIVNIYGAFATGGYFALQGARHCSKNKHGVTLAELGIQAPSNEPELSDDSDTDEENAD